MKDGGRTMEEGAEGDEGEHGGRSSYRRGEAGDVGVDPNSEQKDNSFKDLHTGKAIERF